MTRICASTMRTLLLELPIETVTSARERGAPDRARALTVPATASGRPFHYDAHMPSRAVFVRHSLAPDAYAERGMARLSLRLSNAGTSSLPERDSNPIAKLQHLGPQ
jgi:hypothetical protein